MSGTGLIHLYCGDGKGKTTAAVGLAVRHAGAGGKVVNGIQQTANGVRTQTLLIGGADQTCNIIDSLH